MIKKSKVGRPKIKRPVGRPKLDSNNENRNKRKTYEKFNLIKPLQDIPHEEEWRLVDGIDSVTYISNYGRTKWIEEVTLKCGEKRYKEWELPQYPDNPDKNNFYYRVTVRCKDSKNNYRERIHVIGCKAFFEKPDNENEYIPNHIDGIKTHNYFGCKELDYKDSNLEWVTRSENVLHAYRTGLLKVADSDQKNKPVIRIDTGNGKSRKGYVYKNTRDAANHSGVSIEQIMQNTLKKGLERCHGSIYARVNLENVYATITQEVDKGNATVRKFDELNRIAFPNEIKEMIGTDEINIVPIYSKESGELLRVEITPFCENSKIES